MEIAHKVQRASRRPYCGCNVHCFCRGYSFAIYIPNSHAGSIGLSIAPNLCWLNVFFLKRRVLMEQFPCNGYLFVMTSSIIAPAINSISNNINFRFVVFFWYPSAMMSSFSAPLTSVFIRSTL